MLSLLVRSRQLRVLCVVSMLAAGATAQDAPTTQSAGPMSHPPARQAPADAPQTPAPPPAAPAMAPSANFDPAIYQPLLPPAQLTFLKQFDGVPSHDLYHDKQFHKFMKSVMPDGQFHYGSDMTVSNAMDLVMDSSRTPVQVRDGRYVMLSGAKGPYLGGRGFLWIDMQTGIALGGFYFHPSNGEPTPALNIYSRQVREMYLGLSDMPPGFVEDLIQWQTASNIAPITTRYFLTGANKKIVLEHDEDYCLAWDGTRMPPDSGCEQMAADAADLDLTAAYYVDATGHSMNATAWMLSPSETSFIEVRESTCRSGPDPLGCRVRMTRERIGVIVHRPAPAPRPVRH